MAGLTSLYTAVSGLQAAQAGLYVTGHNVANVDRTGYTRQRVLQVDSRYQTAGYQATGAMKVGLGTDVGQVTQLRDKYLDVTYRQEVTKLNFHAIKYGVGVEIETIIGELQSDYKTQSVMQDLWDALNELSLDPTGVDTRGTLITSATKFIDKVDLVYKDLLHEQNVLNQQVKEAVADINTYISEIKDLNYKIADAEASGDRANDYRDTRNYYLDELSKLINIDYKEDPRTGMVNISYEGTGMLVDQCVSPLGLRYTSGDCSFVEPVFTMSKEILAYDPYSSSYQNTTTLLNMTGEINAKNGNDSGALKAMMLARGTKPLNYASNPVEPKEPEITDKDKDGLPLYTGSEDPAYKAAMRKYNVDYKEYEKDLFNATQATIPKFMREFDTMVNSIVTMINDAFSPYTEVAQTQPDGSTKMVKVKDPNAPYGQDGSQYTEIFVRKTMPDRFDEFGNLIAEDPSDQYSLYSMGNIEINPIFSQPSEYDKIALSQSGDINDTRLLNDMLTKWKSGGAVSFDGNSALSVEDYYRNMVTNLGIETNEAKSYMNSHQGTAEQADNKRMQTSSVSLDEEMTNMLTYQHAYSAAARIFNVIDGMLDKLINGTGRAGL